MKPFVEYCRRPDEKEAGSGAKALLTLWSVLTAPLWGWLLAAYYGWFVRPLFGGPDLTIWQALGVGLTYGVLSYKLGSRHISTEELAYRAFEDLTAPLLMLGLGRLFAIFLGVA